MTAIVQDRYGEADVLRTGRVPRPSPGPGEVLLEVAAAGVDRGTWHLMAGVPYLVRPVTGLRTPRNPVPGRDVAGRVVALGEGVTRFAVGDEVFGTARSGSFADLATARADRLALRPPSLTAVQAAALPVSGTTALQAVRDHGKVQPGQKVLVIGASGGVGSYAVQIARADGAEVTGVCGPAKADLVRALGATRVLDHTRDRVADAGPHDVVIDIGGGNRMTDLRAALTPRGRLVVVGSEEGGRWFGMGQALKAVALSPFVRQTLVMIVASEDAAHLEVLAGLATDGALVPAVERTWPLAEAADALRHLVAGRARGKLVVEVRPG